MGQKDLVWLWCEVKSPPFTREGMREVGHLLRKLQAGLTLSMPHSRPMPSVGPRCHELRVRDTDHNWRIIYRIDDDCIPIAGVFAKKTEQTPEREIQTSKERLRRHDERSG